MHKNQTGAIEKAIGAEIAKIRKERGLSQKQFIKKLSDNGLFIDASAVSRLERGDRALRIAECMIIAKSLEISVAMLLRGVQTPEDRIKELAQQADLELTAARDRLWAGLATHYEVKLSLERNPELLDAMSDDYDLESPEDYLPMVAKELSLYEPISRKPSQHPLGVRDEGDMDQLLECALAIAKKMIAINPNFPYLDEALKGREDDGHE
ncbi:helix-turn-helix domain-containing protein [Glutamicibacter arilaitensis]|uniref:XRE family transcriptional regulator n=1 Tax=Glutamicibacter arilaitensis TaxID=256701 RepID=A0A4Y8TYM3_9MICC|nr:helix-turn-helix transcriptional regulator [Glutamicibacter arilaitensis]TFH56832.1 XRE family transcriptional regulator [Glutamicibacter arilaitensis]